MHFRSLAMIKAVIVLSAALATVILTAGCDLGPATPLPAAAEAAAPPRPALETPSSPRLDRAAVDRLYPMPEPKEKERKAAILLLLVGGRR